jgi:beta-glucosidase
MTERLDWQSLKTMQAADIDQKALDLVQGMRLEEKANQMAGDLTLPGMAPSFVFKGYCGMPYPAGKDRRWGIEPMRFMDGPRGIVAGRCTCFPVSMARGATFDPDLEERVGDVIGVEGRSVGANFFGGVCINLLRHPAWGRAQETYGEDPHHLGEMGAALVRGVQRHLMACVKHFALNSMENMRFEVNVRVDERTLREIYLPHFKRCVDEGAAAVMSAYNQVNGHYCGENKHLLTDILKEDWGFEGFVITDFIFGVRDAAKGINAGLDVEMPAKKLMTPRKIARLVRDGRVDEGRVTDAAFRHIRTKMRFAGIGEENRYGPEQCARPEHVRLAREAAEKSMVLLKNDRQTLPFDPGTTRTLAVIGQLADTANTGDHGSSNVNPPWVVTPLAGIRQFLNEGQKVQYDPGRDPARAARLAADADAAVIVAGTTYKEEGEYISQIGWHVGGDRASLRLKPEDEALILAVAESQPNLVVVLESGAALITEAWRESVPAILMAWYPGMAGGEAMSRLLFGVVNPSGKLPCVFPKSEDDLPFFDRFAREITYDGYHGYRLMDREDKTPAFPFGFGLSYTSFEYDRLSIQETCLKSEDTLTVEVQAANTGDRAGEEVVQVYTGCLTSRVPRPIKELKAFKKIALEPGEQKNVSFTIPLSQLAFYDAEKGRWEVEAAEYRLLAGAPGNRLLEARFTVVES